MREVVDYHIVTKVGAVIDLDAKRKFEIAVMKKLNEGYELHGHLNVQITSMNYQIYSQAVIQYAKT